MSSISRNMMIDNVCQTLQVLASRAVSAKELADEVGYSTLSARRYIDGVSIYFPVESEKMETHSGNIVEKFKIVSLINKEELKKDIIREVTSIINQKL